MKRLVRLATPHIRTAGFLVTLLLSALVASPVCAQATAKESGRRSPALPEVDLSGLEPAVVEQITTLREHTETVLAEDAGAGTTMARAEAIGELGRLYQAYELLDPAEVCFREAAALAPQDFRWRYHLAYLLQRAGRLEEAAPEYERALGIYAEVPPALVRLGQVYLALNQTEAAEQVLRRALELDPVSASAQATLGEVLLAQERFDEAVTMLESALDKVPEATRLYYPLALAYRGLGEQEKSRELISKRGAVGVRPADPLIDGLADLTTGERVHILRGRAAFGAGRYQEAAEEFRRAAGANPESIPARINLGTALSEIGETEEAIEQYRAAIELGPGNVAARFNLGVLLAEQGALEEAAEELRGAVQYGPRDATAHYELAVVQRRLGRSEDALTHFALSAELAPPGERARVGRAATLVDLGRYAEARTVLEEALAAQPSSGPVAYSLARLLAACPDVSLRDGERALDLAMRVHAARKSVSDVQLVAEALAELGRCDEAAEWQTEAVAAVTTSTPPPTLLEAVRERLDRYEQGPPCRPHMAPTPADSGPVQQ